MTDWLELLTFRGTVLTTATVPLRLGFFDC